MALARKRQNLVAHDTQGPPPPLLLSIRTSQEICIESALHDSLRRHKSPSFHCLCAFLCLEKRFFAVFMSFWTCIWGRIVSQGLKLRILSKKRGRVISLYRHTLKSHIQRGSFIGLQINCFVKHLSIERRKLYVFLRLSHLLQLLLVLLNGTALSQHRIHVAYGNMAGGE